ASILLMGPRAKVITPAIVESWFSTSTELTSAMALIQTLAVALALILLFAVARRAAQHPGEGARIRRRPAARARPPSRGPIRWAPTRRAAAGPRRAPP